MVYSKIENLVLWARILYFNREYVKITGVFFGFTKVLQNRASVKRAKLLEADINSA